MGSRWAQKTFTITLLSITLTIVAVLIGNALFEEEREPSSSPSLPQPPSATQPKPPPLGAQLPLRAREAPLRVETKSPEVKRPTIEAQTPTRRVLPDDWTPGRTLGDFMRQGVLGYRIDLALKASSAHGFQLLPSASLPTVEGLGARVEYRVREGIIIGATVNFAPRASSADLMGVLPLLGGDQLNIRPYPGTLSQDSRGVWTLEDGRRIDYLLDVSGSGASEVLERLSVSLRPTGD